MASKLLGHSSPHNWFKNPNFSLSRKKKILSLLFSSLIRGLELRKYIKTIRLKQSYNNIFLLISCGVFGVRGMLGILKM